MNMFDAQARMSQFTDPESWKAWFAAVPEIGKHPLSAILDEAGASIGADVINQLQADYTQQAGALWRDFLAQNPPPLDDRRFAAPEWRSNALHAFNAAAYLLNAQFLTRLAAAVEAPPRIKQKIEFAVQQVIDAMSPANFLATNPEAQQKMLETGGESLSNGIANLLADMKKGHISQSDESAFEVGRNVATTAGAVIYENNLFQLIQYRPLTATVYQRPLLMVPPCINKYYILDLQPENSVVRYAVEHGHTVYLMSWRNPDESMAKLGWEDYIEAGVLEGVRVVQAISKQEKINMLGFCVGGTLLANALAVQAARGVHPAASVTLLTTLLDFSDTGILQVFIDEQQVALKEQSLAKGGLMPGRDLASTFASLRPNDLVWNYVQSNYLKGKTPPAFDLLYWNADSTSLPGPMFCWYLRNTYLENNLMIPGKLQMGGVAVDLGTIEAPTFVYGSRDDHIVPWTAAYASLRLLNPGHPERNRFVLGASGHIAGVINHPKKNKRSFWTNDKPLPKRRGARRAGPLDAEQWLQGAHETPGSWWGEWLAFLSLHGGKQVKAPARPGNTKFKMLEPAPGRYVKVRAD